MAAFDFAPLLPAGSPAPVARWTGLAKFSFVGGNNDADAVPVEGLTAAVNAVLRREGRSLATYGLAHGPQGYRPLRDFLSAKLGLRLRLLEVRLKLGFGGKRLSFRGRRLCLANDLYDLQLILDGL